jgi:hypothetical protein
MVFRFEEGHLQVLGIGGEVGCRTVPTPDPASCVRVRRIFTAADTFKDKLLLDDLYEDAVHHGKVWRQT